jgi:hypothetical protein
MVLQKLRPARMTANLLNSILLKSKVRKEFKERQEKLKRKEISSRKFGRMMVFDIVGDLKTERPVKMS